MAFYGLSPNFFKFMCGFLSILSFECLWIGGMDILLPPLECGTAFVSSEKSWEIRSFHWLDPSRKCEMRPQPSPCCPWVKDSLGGCIGEAYMMPWSKHGT